MASLITREEAAGTGRKTYYLGTPCKKGHISERYTSNGACIACLARFRRVSQNPWTKELTPFTLQGNYFVPTAMTAEHYKGLAEYLHQCVEHWVGANGLATPSVQNAYQQAAMHRARKATT